MRDAGSLMARATYCQRCILHAARAIVAALGVAASGCASTGSDAPQTNQETATGAMGGALGAAGGALGGAALGAVAGLQCGVGAILCSPVMAIVYGVKGAVMAGEAGARKGVNLARSTSAPEPAESAPEKPDHSPASGPQVPSPQTEQKQEVEAMLDVRAGTGGRETAVPGLPAAGTTWVYSLVDRLYGRQMIDVTIRATRVDGSSIEESVAHGAASGPESQRTVSAGEARFISHGLAGETGLTEFAPYFLAANRENASAVGISAVGYPVVSGDPGWIAQAEPQFWDQVTVPAGNYRALRLAISGRRVRVPSDPNTSREFLFHVWYAPGVRRYVKLEHKEWLHSNRQYSHVVVELTKFSPPP